MHRSAMRTLLACNLAMLVCWSLPGTAETPSLTKDPADNLGNRRGRAHSICPPPVTCAGCNMLAYNNARRVGKLVCGGSSLLRRDGSRCQDLCSDSVGAVRGRTLLRLHQMHYRGSTEMPKEADTITLPGKRMHMQLGLILFSSWVGAWVRWVSALCGSCPLPVRSF